MFPMCEWHTECNRPVAGRINLPHRSVWACRVGMDEYNDLYRPSALALSDEQIATLNLTKRERRELEEMPIDERNAVLRFLLEVKARKNHEKHAEKKSWKYKTAP